MEIIPAILEKDLQNIKTKLDFLVSVKHKYALNFNTVQIDIADGKFVKSVTWLPDDNTDVSEFDIYKSHLNIEYHLMCTDQYKYFNLVKKLGAKSVVIHIDNILDTNILRDIVAIARDNIINIVITGSIDFLLENKESTVRFLDDNRQINLQIMGINRVGLQGQNFDERCLGLISFFRKSFSINVLSIQVDGSINNTTISDIDSRGTNKAIVGSYLINSVDEFEFVKKYKTISN